MISYEPLWKTMKDKKATTYTLRNKGKPYDVGSATVGRIKMGKSISTNTIDAICKILDCDILDIIKFVPD